ncbi:MAG: phage tail protein, partial [Anaerolineae bacterium]
MANTDAPTDAQTALLPVPASSPAALAHVADHQHRYPGESVRLFTRIDLHQASADLQVHVGLPEGLALVEQKPLAAPGGVAPHLAVGNDNRSLVWMLRGPIPAGSRFEFETQARVQPVAANTRLTSLATVVAADGYPLVEEALTLRVWAQGRYLRHLPELYARDEFMARFLMLFESFWAPLETQIDAMDYYLAPGTTPERLLPWLASWVGLALDARLPRDRQRALVRAAIWLHRRRGTRQALQQY